MSKIRQKLHSIKRLAHKHLPPLLPRLRGVGFFPVPSSSSSLPAESASCFLDGRPGKTQLDDTKASGRRKDES